MIRLDVERPVPHTRYPSPRIVNPNPIHSVETTGSNNTPVGSDPIVLDGAEIFCIGQEGRLTDEERERKFGLKLYLRCGKAGH